MSYFVIGPIAIRVSTKNLARWGFPLIRVGGLSLLSRDSGGGLSLAGYHPRSSVTWHWNLSLRRTPGARPGPFNLQWRKGYGSKGFTLFGWSLSFTEQGYHKERPA